MFVTSLFVVEGPNETPAIRSLGDVPIGAFFVLAAASGALIWRRHRPLLVLVATLVATSLATVLGYSELIGLTFLVALYSVGRNVTSDRWSYLGLGGALSLTLIIALVEEVTAAEIGFGLVVMSALWYIGRRMRFRGERVAQLERERVAEARRMVAEERTRIARELHDVVAHRVSMMTVQAGAAKTVAADDPEGAQRAMEAVEKAGRQALDELRHLLGVLRPEAEVDGLGPQPRLADVPRLVGQFREAGLEVSLTMDSAQPNVPARVDLSAYRIVQEALTNVLKHAGPAARTEVRLRTDSHGVAIEVLDDGHGDTILAGSGQGIVGMRERAQLLGGSLDAGPRPNGGFQVVAHLPIGAERA
jgi:signal transduction histidine kinase